MNFTNLLINYTLNINEEYISILNCFFNNILSSNSGGAIFCSLKSFLFISNCLFFKCSINNGRGGCIYSSSKINKINKLCFFESFSSGLYPLGSDFYIVESENISNQYCSSLYSSSTYSESFSIRCNNIISSNNNISNSNHLYVTGTCFGNSKNGEIKYYNIINSFGNNCIALVLNNFPINSNLTNLINNSCNVGLIRIHSIYNYLNQYIFLKNKGFISEQIDSNYNIEISNSIFDISNINLGNGIIISNGCFFDQNNILIQNYEMFFTWKCKLNLKTIKLYQKIKYFFLITTIIY